MTPAASRALVWFRRDLRDDDHAALAHAGRHAESVFCAFVFDRDILDPLEQRADRRVEFIRHSVQELDAALRARGGGLVVLHQRAREAIPALARMLGVGAVYANRDYEPEAMARDEAVAAALAADAIAFETLRDQVIFDRDEIMTRTGTPYAVFTPYQRAWLERVTPQRLAAQSTAHVVFAAPPAPLDRSVPTLAELGFASTDLAALRARPGMRAAADAFADFARRIDAYADARDFPARGGTSHLSVHLRFGTVSIRTLARFAHARMRQPDGKGAASWLSELIWREFYAQILFHHPHVVDHAFRPTFDSLRFPSDPGRFAAWCEGRTGYPIVDAGMRELNATGTMHNRLRMITASFLVKDLLVDWRLGERYFAKRLLDYDLASNSGGWQWAASTGCDAQPWFRIFNPETQSRRFDAHGAYIRRHVPELATLDDDAIHAPYAAAERRRSPPPAHYPPPIVDHANARAAALAFFGQGGTTSG